MYVGGSITRATPRAPATSSSTRSQPSRTSSEASASSSSARSVTSSTSDGISGTATRTGAIASAQQLTARAPSGNVAPTATPMPLSFASATADSDASGCTISAPSAAIATRAPRAVTSSGHIPPRTTTCSASLSRNPSAMLTCEGG